MGTIIYFIEKNIVDHKNDQVFTKGFILQSISFPGCSSGHEIVIEFLMAPATQPLGKAAVAVTVHPRY